MLFDFEQAGDQYLERVITGMECNEAFLPLHHHILILQVVMTQMKNEMLDQVM